MRDPREVHSPVFERFFLNNRLVSCLLLLSVCFAKALCQNCCCLLLFFSSMLIFHLRIARKEKSFSKRNMYFDHVILHLPDVFLLPIACSMTHHFCGSANQRGCRDWGQFSLPTATSFRIHIAGIVTYMNTIKKYKNQPNVSKIYHS